jgi:hypothetical protein
MVNDIMKRVQEIYLELGTHSHEIQVESEDAADFADNLVRAGIELTIIKERERYHNMFKEYLKKKRLKEENANG